MKNESNPKSPSLRTDTSPCDTCESREKGFFCQSDPETLRRVDEAKGLRKFRAGETIFQAGEEPEGIYCLKKGTVKLESTGENGQAHILHIVNAGGVLGLRASIDGAPFQATAVALQPTELCFIPRAIFDQVLKQDPTIALNALRTVTFELQEMEKRFCHATDLSATERIAEALLHLKDRFENQQWSRREFAEWASTTTETVIRTLAQFDKEGLISIEGRKIIIKDRPRLLEKAKIFV